MELERVIANGGNQLVLILIVMEDTHGEDYEILYAFFVGS